MYKLLEIIDGNVIREHLLSGERFRIGRNPGNDLQPDDPSVSGNHAAISLVPNDYLDDAQDVVIEDLGSTNGTRVNGTRVTQQRLKHGDMLAMGTLQMKLVDEQTLALGGTRILLQDDEV
jgi:pSer/pThr/pTyr-binding forkhead associated (FHA) protein